MTWNISHIHKGDVSKLHSKLGHFSMVFIDTRENFVNFLAHDIGEQPVQAVILQGADTEIYGEENGIIMYSPDFPFQQILEG